MQFTHEAHATVPLPACEVRAHWTEAASLPSCVSHVRAVAASEDDDLARIVISLDGRLIEFAAQRTLCEEDTVCWQALGREFLWVLSASFAPAPGGTLVTVCVAYDPPGFLPDLAEAAGVRHVFRRALEADLHKYAASYGASVPLDRAAAARRVDIIPARDAV